jgi:DNA-binding FrmR family transcriptional regulator
MGVYPMTHGHISEDTKQRALHRLKIIEGQVKGLSEAIEREEYCIDLLKLSLSIQRALGSLDQMLLKNHLEVHVHGQMKTSPDQATRELLEIYSLSQK